MINLKNNSKVNIIISTNIIILIINCVLMVQAFINSINNYYSTEKMINTCSPFFIGMIISFLISNFYINKLK